MSSTQRSKKQVQRSSARYKSPIIFGLLSFLIVQQNPVQFSDTCHCTARGGNDLTPENESGTGGCMMDSIWVTIIPILVINVLFLITIFYFAATRERHPVPEEVLTRHNSKFLSAFFKEYWYWLTTPVAKFLIAMRFSPNIITFCGTMMNIIPAYLFATGRIGWAGWAMVWAATFDLMDGKIARLTGKSFRSGAVYDSVMDRFGEGIMMIGLAIYFRNSWILYFVMAGLIGAMTVSYARAKAESMGVSCKEGTMQRPERVVYLGVSSLLQPAVDFIMIKMGITPFPILTICAVCLVGVMTNATAVYRMLYVMDVLDKADHKPGSEDSIPRTIVKLAQKSRSEDVSPPMH